MITAIAIDDEPKAVQVIQHHVSKIDSLELIAHFYNARDALQFLRQNPVDLMFLDINMPHMSGLELLDGLQSKPQIVFTTAYSEFAVDSYAYNAVDYLLKPFEFDRFQIAIHKVEARLASLKQQNQFFFIRDGFKNIKVEFETILFVKGAGNYLDITTKDKVFSPRMTFMELVAKLPASQFVRVHQSFMVNISEINKIENNHVYIDGQKIAIGNRYKEVLFKRLNLM
ncbi:LytR/AlgR family response regulator transcription factor [Snuella sedimenti]|uniref:Response regulator transcription factor n=1 Tax=Snuella sedimenti TaxID=2798802 RepID=A0A8J7IMV8_9FLAO|nr:response regulator transcription factor [Snuella sedimenti]MBJ6367542.1 response regulator transcription factor [Snuella sedimenti]